MSTGRKILLYLLYVIALVAFATAIILAITNHGPTKTEIPLAKPATSQATPKTTPKQMSPATPKSGSDTDAAAEATKQAIANNATSSPATDTQLTNTGPGSVLALFVVTTLAGAFAYHRRQVVLLSK